MRNGRFSDKDYVYTHTYIYIYMDVYNMYLILAKWTCVLGKENTPCYIDNSRSLSSIPVISLRGYGVCEVAPVLSAFL